MDARILYKSRGPRPASAIITEVCSGYGDCGPAGVRILERGQHGKGTWDDIEVRGDRRLTTLTSISTSPQPGEAIEQHARAGNRDYLGTYPRYAHGILGTYIGTYLPTNEIHWRHRQSTRQHQPEQEPPMTATSHWTGARSMSASSARVRPWTPWTGGNLSSYE